MTTDIEPTKKTKAIAVKKNIKLTEPLSDEALAKLMERVIKGEDGKLPFDGKEKADQLFKERLLQLGIETRPTTESDGKGCWIWKGTTNTIRGIIRPQSLMLDDKYVQPYRSSYATWIGKGLPSDVHIDHRCKTLGEGKALCIRPGHGHCIAVPAKVAQTIEMMFDGKQPKKGSGLGKPLATARINNSPEITAIVKAHYAKKTRAVNKAKLLASKSKPRKAKP
jgi:hypothetical protein